MCQSLRNFNENLPERSLKSCDAELKIVTLSNNHIQPITLVTSACLSNRLFPIAWDWNPEGIANTLQSRLP